jgi:formate hydrogenlyase subunit 6/NADH:ubiquinone oxidoreductase subunit I
LKTKTSYWNSLGIAARTLSQGLAITFSHMAKAGRKRKQVTITEPDYFQHQEGIATVQYPHVTIPVPDTGRYQLHNEIEDCIVCDKCVKICPVNCIAIDPIRSSEEFGKTSDGTPKRIYAAKFDIDMGKCCFCGLCTTVCPTECLTMTKAYDFSTFDIHSHHFAFAKMSPQEIEEKRNAWEVFQRSKNLSTPASQNPKTSGQDLPRNPNPERGPLS